LKDLSNNEEIKKSNNNVEYHYYYNIYDNVKKYKKVTLFEGLMIEKKIILSTTIINSTDILIIMLLFKIIFDDNYCLFESKEGLKHFLHNEDIINYTDNTLVIPDELFVYDDFNIWISYLKFLIKTNTYYNPIRYRIWDDNPITLEHLYKLDSHEFNNSQKEYKINNIIELIHNENNNVFDEIIINRIDNDKINQTFINILNFYKSKENNTNKYFYVYDIRKEFQDMEKKYRDRRETLFDKLSIEHKIVLHTNLMFNDAIIIMQILKTIINNSSKYFESFKEFEMFLFFEYAIFSKDYGCRTYEISTEDKII
jgi:hypothetical protein